MSKIVVIGAGILGASTTYHLAKQGADVTVIDRRDPGQATDAAAGIVCPWLSQRRNQAWYRLARAGARFYPQLITELEEEGEKETGYARVGALSIHTDLAKLQAMEQRALKRRKDAPEIGEIRLLSPEETRTLFPPIAEDYSSVHVTGAARVDGRALRNALLRAAERHGAEIVYEAASVQFTEHRGAVVTTNEKTYHPDIVILTTGAWASSLLRPLGINLQVDFQKGQIVHMQLPDIETKGWPVIMPPGNQYLVSFDNGRLAAGATHEKQTGFDLRVTAGSMNEILQRALEIAPGLANSTILEARVGFRPFTPDFLPVIGQLPGVDGVFLANGLGSSGLTMGPYIGSELAKLVLEKEIEIDLDLYDVKTIIK